MKEVEYVSSAGIRVLFQTYKQLKEIHGTFAVSEPSEAVRSVLELAGVAELLFEKAPSGDVQSSRLRKRRLLCAATRALRFSKATPVK